MSRNDSVVAFLRHFNDVDHIFPVAMTVARQVPVRLVITDEQAASHPLLASGEMLSGIELVRIEDLLGESSPQAAIPTIVDNPESLELAVADLGRRPCVAMDWLYSTFSNVVCEFAKARGLTSVSLPHGDAPYTNLLINVDDLDGTLARHYEGASRFDHTVVPNRYCAPRYKTLARNRLHVLGSPRYNSSWLRTLDRTMPPPPFGSELTGPRVAIFLRNANFPVHWEEVDRTIQLLADRGLGVAVMHHTRDKRTDEVRRQIPTLQYGEFETHVVVAPTVTARTLMGWADLVLDLGTSVAFESIVRGQPTAELEYVHANRSTVAETVPSTDLKCRDDLVAVVEAAKRNGRFVSPTRRERRRFRRRVIEPRRGVLDRYARLLMNAEPAR